MRKAVIVGLCSAMAEQACISHMPPGGSKSGGGNLQEILVSSSVHNSGHKAGHSEVIRDANVHNQ